MVATGVRYTTDRPGIKSEIAGEAVKAASLTTRLRDNGSPMPPGTACYLRAYDDALAIRAGRQAIALGCELRGT